MSETVEIGVLGNTNRNEDRRYNDVDDSDEQYKLEVVCKVLKAQPIRYYHRDSDNVESDCSCVTESARYPKY
jgi:hypothetical protein